MAELDNKYGRNCSEEASWIRKSKGNQFANETKLRNKITRNVGWDEEPRLSIVTTGKQS